MTNVKPCPWHSVLPRELIDRAYTSSSEFAWSRADALQVVQLLQNAGYRIFGVDTWLPTRPGPTPLIRDWSENHAMSASDFIATFQRDRASGSKPDLEPYFNITA